MVDWGLLAPNVCWKIEISISVTDLCYNIMPIMSIKIEIHLYVIEYRENI